MRKYQLIFCCLFVLLTMASCGSSKPIVLQNETIKTRIETVHDTVFRIEKDSSSIQALIECINGKPVIKKVIQSEPGRNLKRPDVHLKGNVLRVDCEAEAQRLFAQYKDTYESNIEIKTLPPIEVNRLTAWQKLQINLFRIYAGLTLLLAGWVFIKSKI